MKKNNNSSHSKKETKKKVQSSSTNTQGGILSMGEIDITFKIEFSDEDLEIKTEEEQKPEENKDNEEKIEKNKDNEDKKEENKEENWEIVKQYYNIEDFKNIKDLKFLEGRKDVWDKFQLIPNNNTLDHLLLANALRKNNVITEYIGFGRPLFINDEKFFEKIFEHVSKRNNILFSKTPLSEQTKCRINFEFIHKKKIATFETERNWEGSKEDEEKDEKKEKEKENNIPDFSRKEGALAKIRPENSKYSLFYLNYEDLEKIPGDFKNIDLIELMHFLRKRGAKVFINFYKNEYDETQDEREPDKSIAPEHFSSNGVQNVEISVKEEDNDMNKDDESKLMNETNNIYYLTDIYFFEFNEAPKIFNKHYQFFSADKIKSSVNKGNLYDYFIKGIATGTKDQVEKEKFGFFIDYFNKLYIVRADKKIGNIYEFDLKIHKPINIYNIKEIQNYKELIKQNKNYYISLILSFILSSIKENKSNGIDTLFKGYLNSLEIIKKKVELEINDIFTIKEKDYINKKKINDSIDIKLKTLAHIGQENGFILDCTNEEKSKLKDYVPLYDTHLVNYLRSNKNQKELIKKGFINKNGFIMIDPQYRKMMRDDEQPEVNDKDQLKKEKEDEIKNTDFEKNATSKILDSQKESLNTSRPTKKKIPKNKIGPGNIYLLSEQSDKKKKKDSKNNTINNKSKYSENSKKTLEKVK